jgi:hypothetical protein
MLTDDELRKALEPHAQKWAWLYPFAREIERLATENAASICDERAEKCALKAGTADSEDAIELKSNAWQFSVLAADIRKLVSNV